MKMPALRFPIHSGLGGIFDMQGMHIQLVQPTKSFLNPYQTGRPETPSLRAGTH
jgi:hypothetical protein